MSRVLLLGIALALAALCVPSDATGAPASSPFAGQYRGGLPDSGSGGWYITISDKGAVTAWWSLSEAYYHGDGEASGQVADGGAIRVRGKEWAQWWSGSYYRRIRLSGSATLDLDGNLLVTDDATGWSDLWRRY